MSDSIEFYDDETIKAWWIRFQSVPSDVVIISDVPFSYYDVRDEILRRERLEEQERNP